MRLSTCLAVPLYSLTISGLAIPTNSENSHNVTVAGSIVSDNITSQVASLETEYQRLEELKIQLNDLHHKVLRQEHQILELIKHDFTTCAGVKCYLQTALRKAPDFVELLKTHFRIHFQIHPKNSTAGPFDCSWSTKPADVPTEPIELFVTEFEGEHRPPPPPPFGHGHPPPPPPPGHEHSPPLPPPSDGHPSPPDRPSPPGHEHPPPPPPPPGHGDHDPFQPGHEHPPPPPPPHSPEDHEPFQPGHGHPPEHEPWKQNPAPPGSQPEKPDDHGRPHHMPHPAPRHRHYRLILATAGLVASFLIFGILFKALRFYLSNPRVRADRAARIEEHRTRREYRRAACKHRFRQVIARFGRGGRRGSKSLDDYEEKRAMLQQRDGQTQVDGHIVGPDISSLRRAHEIVEQLMRAEEGRVRRTTQGDMTTPSSSRSVISESTTLPPYAPPPPRYSQELSRDMEVVDGFRYTPSNSEATPPSSASSFVLDDDMTESSVVDCRSRMSIDTESVPQSEKSLELASDRYRGQFD